MKKLAGVLALFLSVLVVRADHVAEFACTNVGMYEWAVEHPSVYPAGFTSVGEHMYYNDNPCDPHFMELQADMVFPYTGWLGTYYNRIFVPEGCWLEFQVYFVEEEIYTSQVYGPYGHDVVLIYVGWDYELDVHSCPTLTYENTTYWAHTMDQWHDAGPPWGPMTRGFDCN